MSEILNTLLQAQLITEWIDPFDLRLAEATGQPVPNDGGEIRENWDITAGEQTMVLNALKRLLSPSASAPCVSATFYEDAFFNRAELFFTQPNDWKRSFPIIDSAEVETGRHPARTWAGIALCDKPIGLAVFAVERALGIQAFVQPVPSNFLQKITRS